MMFLNVENIQALYILPIEAGTIGQKAEEFKKLIQNNGQFYSQIREKREIFLESFCQLWHETNKKLIDLHDIGVFENLYDFDFGQNGLN